MSIASDTPYQSGEDMGENETESVMGGSARKVAHFGSWPSMER